MSDTLVVWLVVSGERGTEFRPEIFTVAKMALFLREQSFSVRTNEVNRSPMPVSVYLGISTLKKPADESGKKQTV